MAVEAILEPLKVENSVPLMTAMKLNLPGTPPSHLSSVSIIFGATPDLNMSSPMRMNSGIGSMVKLMTDPYILRIIWSRPPWPPQRKKAAVMLTNKKLKATGTPRANKKKRPNMIIRKGANQSIRGNSTLLQILRVFRIPPLPFHTLEYPHRFVYAMLGFIYPMVLSGFPGDCSAVAGLDLKTRRL